MYIKRCDSDELEKFEIDRKNLKKNWMKIL